MRQAIARLVIAAVFLSLLAVALQQPDTNVRVRFAGTGHPDIVPDKPRMQAGIVVDIGPERWLLDAGAGVFARLYDNKIPIESLNHIFLSHLHYDHCLDLDAILLLWQTSGPPPAGPGNPPPVRNPLHLWGPDGAEKFVNDLYDVAYGLDGRGRRLLKNPLFKRTRSRDAGVVQAKNYKTSFHEVKHGNAGPDGMDCWGVKFETAKGSIVYSGDIGSPRFTKAEEHKEFAEWAKGADMLIIDTLHLAPEELAGVVGMIKPKTLVLSHLSERFLPVFKHYDLNKTVEMCKRVAGKVIVAQEGMEVKL